MTIIAGDIIVPTTQDVAITAGNSIPPDDAAGGNPLPHPHLH
jgi:hypothetical protein